MARKQVIVQLDDDLVHKLDLEATAARASRSEVIRSACREYLQNADEREAERRHAEAYRRLPQGAEWDDDYALLSPKQVGDPRATKHSEAG